MKKLIAMAGMIGTFGLWCACSSQDNSDTNNQGAQSSQDQSSNRDESQDLMSHEQDTAVQGQMSAQAMQDSSLRSSNPNSSNTPITGSQGQSGTNQTGAGSTGMGNDSIRQ